MNKLYLIFVLSSIAVAILLVKQIDSKSIPFLNDHHRSSELGNDDNDSYEFVTDTDSSSKLTTLFKNKYQ